MYTLLGVKFNDISVNEVRRAYRLSKSKFRFGKDALRETCSPKVASKILALREKAKPAPIRVLLKLVSSKAAAPKCACGKQNNFTTRLCPNKPACRESFQCRQRIIEKAVVDKYGVSNVAKLESVKDKMQATCLDRYGVANVFSLPGVSEKGMLAKHKVSHNSQLQSTGLKRRETNRARFGVDCAFQSEAIKEKIKTTWIQKYGHTNPAKSDAVKKKIQKRIEARYGVNCFFKRVDLVQKAMLKKHGVRHPLQKPEFYEKYQKSSKTYKRVRLGNRYVRVQGAEDYALAYMLRTVKLHPEQIKVSMSDPEVPVIQYTYKGRHRVYYPDFLVGENTLVEVKSTFTLYHNRRIFSVVQAKAKACVRQGFQFKLVLVDNRQAVTLPQGWTSWDYCDVHELVKAKLASVSHRPRLSRKAS